MGPSGSGLYCFTKLGGKPSRVWVRSNLCHCSTVTSLAAMANRRGMTHAAWSFRRGITFRLRRRRAHAELDRSLDHGERLPLAVDEPAPLAPVLDLHQLGIQFLELLLLLPLPQGPFRRPVDAAVGVVAVEIEQLADQWLPLAGG